VEAPPGTSTLAPGASTTVTLRASLITSAPFLCTFAIANNDSDENPFVIRIGGQPL
jgi:hypothetical protein